MHQERKSDGRRSMVKHHGRDIIEQITGQTTKATTKGWGCTLRTQLSGSKTETPTETKISTTLPCILDNHDLSEGVQKRRRRADITNKKAKTQKTVRAQRKGSKRIESWGSQCSQQGVSLSFGTGNLHPHTRDVIEVDELRRHIWRTTTAFSYRENVKRFSKDSLGAATLPHRVPQTPTACRLYNLIR